MKTARLVPWTAMLGAVGLLAVGLVERASPAEPVATHCADHTGHASAAVPVAFHAGQQEAPRKDHGVPPNVAELVRQVHQASLVEIWIGHRAQEVSTNTSVRWVGSQLVVEHERLDKHVADVATVYDIPLPSEPTQWQQAGARKMARETGRAFDLAFANTLYYGHDRVMELIDRAQREVDDRPAIDPRVRKFVAVGREYVARHMQWLLATGFVTTASTEGAERQVRTAQVVSRTRTFSNAIPAFIGVASLLLIVAVVAVVKFGPAMRRRPRGAVVRHADGARRAR